MSTGWSYGCCKSIDNAACIECSDCGKWWHYSCLIDKYNYRRVHLEGFSDDGEEWLCPPCFAGQEGYGPLDASIQKEPPSKRQRSKQQSDDKPPSSRNKKKSNASEYRFNALNISWNDPEAPVQKVSPNKPYDYTERYIAIKALEAITIAIESGEILDVSMELGVTNEIAHKVKVIYDKTISGDRKLAKYNPRTARSLKETLHKIASDKGKLKHPKAHALISPIWIKYIQASTKQQHSGINPNCPHPYTCTLIYT